MADIKSTIFQIDGEVANRIKKKYVSTGLSYGWKANIDRTYDQGHWNKLILPNSKRFPCDYSNTPALSNHKDIKVMWDLLQENIGNRGFYRTYINGYTFGTDGYAHRDDIWITKKYGDDALSETAILYLNTSWNIDWGGETVIYENNSNMDNNIVEAVLPKLGRVFVFQSNKYHASRPLSRICTELRSILVIKTIDPTIISPQVKFITDITSTVKHTGRTFFEHLFGTMLKLEALSPQVSDDVLLAGLYHSIYGTEFFNYKNSDITRDVVKELIGEYAENLAYEFCNMKNRMNTLMTNSNQYEPNILSDLIKIESCNLADQNANGIYDNQIQQLETKLRSIVRT